MRYCTRLLSILNLLHVTCIEMNTECLLISPSESIDLNNEYITRCSLFINWGYKHDINVGRGSVPRSRPLFSDYARCFNTYADYTIFWTPLAIWIHVYTYWHSCKLACISYFFISFNFQAHYYWIWDTVLHIAKKETKLHKYQVKIPFKKP